MMRAGLMALAAMATVGNAASAKAPDPVSSAVGAALQGDAASAVQALRGVDPAALDAQDRAFLSCMGTRFGSERPADEWPASITDPTVRSILAAYRDYWHDTLTGPSRRAEAEARLLETLRIIVEDPRAADIDAIEPLVRQRLREAGYRSLQGRTGMLRELMVWGREEERLYDVDLPGGSHRTRVHLLDDFLSLGWGDFATCGRRGAGGWATGDALFAVVPRYRSLEAEEFRVTFLGHETQHFADLGRFSGLAPWELEYRAKLVELAQVDETRDRVLLKFTEDQGDDPASPHSYANKRVLRAVADRLGLPGDADLRSIDVVRLNRAAAEVLDADTKQRQG